MHMTKHRLKIVLIENIRTKLELLENTLWGIEIEQLSDVDLELLENLNAELFWELVEH